MAAERAQKYLDLHDIGPLFQVMFLLRAQFHLLMHQDIK